MVMFSRLPRIDYDKIPVKPEDLFSKPVNMDRNINLFNNRSVKCAHELLNNKGHVWLTCAAMCLRR